MPRNIKIRTPEENVLVLLIRGGPIGPALGPCRFDELSRLAVSQMLLSPLASRIAEESGIDAEWRRWAATAAVASERDAGLCRKALDKTISFLVSKGISPIVMKGISLALGVPRDSGDVDLLISESALTRAIALLEAGYVYRGFDRNMHIRRSEYREWRRLSRWSIQYEFEEPDTGALIELHTAFFETKRVYAEDLSALRASIGEFAAASVVDEATGYRFLALEDRALLLALHAALKRSPANKSFVLRHLVDIRGLVDAGLDWEKLERRAFQFGVAHHLVFLLRLHETVAGPVAPPGFAEGIESRLSPSMVRLTRLHLRCMRGLDSYDKLAIFAYKYASPFILHGTARARLRSLLVLPLVVPPRYELAKTYGLPQRSPLVFLLYLLEPGRWTFRLLRKASRTLKAP